MIDPLSIGLTIEYVAEEDRKSDNPTIWIIGALDSFTQSKLISSFMDISTKEGLVDVKKIAGSDHPDFAIVKYGMKGFKNFGNIEFKSEKISSFGQDFEVVSDSILKIIPLSIIHELAGVIWKSNQVDEELKKK